MPKLLNNHLAIEARVALWSSAVAGPVTCPCGHTLECHGRSDVGPLQWHFLQCALEPERAVRHSRRAAVKRALADTTTDLAIVETVLACWTHRTDVTIRTAAADKDEDWRPPTLTQRDMDGDWEFDNSGVPAAFDPTARSGVDTDSDESNGGSDAHDDTHINTANGVYATFTIGTTSNDWRAPLTRRYSFSASTPRKAADGHLEVVVHAMALGRGVAP
jgi:hypothetical protein